MQNQMVQDSIKNFIKKDTFNLKYKMYLLSMSHQYYFFDKKCYAEWMSISSFISEFKNISIVINTKKIPFDITGFVEKSGWQYPKKIGEYYRAGVIIGDSIYIKGNGKDSNLKEIKKKEWDGYME